MLDFTPDPIAFTIGPLPVYWYGIGYALGLAAAYLVMVRLARRAGEDDEILGNGMIVVAIAALVGGRLYHVIDQWALYKDDPIKIFLPPYSGLGVYGGIVTGTIAAFLYARYKKVPFLRWTDIIAPGLFTMQAIARWGNFFNQELYGTPTTLPWGIPIDCAHRISGATFDYTCAVLPESTRFHPLFLYESLSGVLGLLVLVWLGFHARKRLRPGDLLLVFFIWYAVVRFVLETFREGNWTFYGVPVAQIVSVLFIAGAGLILLWRHRPGHPTDAPATHPEVATWGAIGGPVADGDDEYDDDEYDDDEYDDEDDQQDDGDEGDRRMSPPRAKARATRPMTIAPPATLDTHPTSRPSPHPTSRPSPRPTTGRPAPDMTAPPGSRPRRPPPGRVSPEALAAARGGAVEGLVWLGRPPEAKASILYRLLRLVARFVLFVVFRFRIRTSGQEHLPTGGYLLVGAAHRGWMDPFVAMHAIPLQPRAWFLGSAPSTFTTRWRERLIHRLGGLLPVWRGGIGIDQHVESARAVIAGGAVFVQMPEGTVSGPPGRVGPFRTGWAVIALRTDAPIVPLAIAGTEELYLGRRMASRILPATSVRTLAGLSEGAALPAEGTRAELDVARRMSAALTDLLGPAVAALYPATFDPPGHPRRLRRRLTWLLLRPGRLDREA